MSSWSIVYEVRVKLSGYVAHDRFVTATGGVFSLVGQVAMSYRMVMKSKEYWRVGTSMFLFDLDSPLDIYTLVRPTTTKTM